jgi:hypothetical protein
MPRIVTEFPLNRVNVIKKFYLDPCQFEKWAHQNDVQYTGDFVEGVLLDSFTVFTKHGIAAIYEHVVNSNPSNYYVEFTRLYKDSYPGWTKPILRNWWKFAEGVDYFEDYDE